MQGATPNLEAQRVRLLDFMTAGQALGGVFALLFLAVAALTRGGRWLAVALILTANIAAVSVAKRRARLGQVVLGCALGTYAGLAAVVGMVPLVPEVVPVVPLIVLMTVAATLPYLRGRPLLTAGLCGLGVILYSQLLGFALPTPAPAPWMRLVLLTLLPVGLCCLLLLVLWQFSQELRQYLDDVLKANAALEKARAGEEKARVAAEAAIHIREDFLSIASHELKTPLQAAALQAESLARMANRQESLESKTVHSKAVALQRQLRALNRLGDNLLDVSRIAAGGIQVRREAVDFSEVVRDVAGRLGPELERAGSPLDLEVAPCVGTWDRLRLEQVVTNLLSNAIKYGAGKPIRVRLTGDTHSASLSVKDQGIGIAPEDQAHVFDRFARAGAVQMHYGGLGLGLWIVRNVLAAMGGTITVRSVVKEGAEFVAVLPLV